MFTNTAMCHYEQRTIYPRKYTIWKGKYMTYVLTVHSTGRNSGELFEHYSASRDTHSTDHVSIFDAAHNYYIGQKCRYCEQSVRL